MIYLDNAATTKCAPEAVEAMLPYLGEKYGNASSIYALGSESRKAVSNARRIIAESLNCTPQEIYFTTGGSEADNWALIATAEANEKKGKHIITTAIEHHAILHTCDYLAGRGFEITYLPVDEDGIISLEELKKAIRPDTILISVMTANNEIGSIQPIKEVGEIAKEHHILFHTDAVQAYGHIPIDVEDMHIDFLSASGHKLNGPKGVGFLYIRNTVKIGSFIHGGAQERGRRAGTENIPAIVGMAAALKEAVANMDENMVKIAAMRDRLIEGLSTIEHSRLNGDAKKRLPGNVNFCFEGIEGESLLLLLDEKGIEASSGSACTSGSLDPSHVLLAIGLPHEVAHGSLRLTLCEENTPEQIEYIIKEVPGIVSYLRDISPIWEELEKGEKKHVI